MCGSALQHRSCSHCFKLQTPPPSLFFILFSVFVLHCLNRISVLSFSSLAFASAGAVPKKLNLFFSAPHDVFAANQSVDAVYLPSREGVLGVMPGAFRPSIPVYLSCPLLVAILFPRIVRTVAFGSSMHEALTEIHLFSRIRFPFQMPSRVIKRQYSRLRALPLTSPHTTRASPQALRRRSPS